MSKLRFVTRIFSKSGARGGLVAELALVFPVVIFLSVLCIDIVELNWIKSAVKAGLTEGIKYSEGLPHLHRNVWNLPDYCKQLLEGGSLIVPNVSREQMEADCAPLRDFIAARAKVVQRSLDEMEPFLPANIGDSDFYDVYHYDPLKNGAIHEPRPLKLAYLPPGYSAKVPGFEGGTWTHNNFRCARALPSGGSIEQERLNGRGLGGGVYDSCAKPEDGDTLPALSALFPTELEAFLRVHPMMLGVQNLRVRAGGYPPGSGDTPLMPLPLCGPAARNYQASETAYSGVLCAAGSASPGAPAFPATGATATWQCISGAANIFCTATRSATDTAGECGPAATDYPEGATAYAGAPCRTGSASANPPFPQAGATASWTCNSLDGGANSNLCVARRAQNGRCGGAAQDYVHNATAFAGGLCDTGSANPAAPAFPAENGTSTWICNGSNGGTPSAPCIATRGAAPVNGECGPAAGDYPESAAAYAGSYCRAGTANVTPAFPAINGTASWICNGINGGTDSPLCVVRRAQDGRCGGAAQNYAHDATAFAGALCASGSANPAGPAFPAQNGSSTWTCSGSNGGNNSSTCTATRGAAPINGECGPAAGDYPESAAAYAGSYCRAGTATVTPAFPAINGTASWICNGINGGTDSPLCVVRRAQDGRCGGAAQNYAHDATAFAGALCAPGSANPAGPAFPAQNGSSTWTCGGSNGGNNSSTCTATRGAAPVNGACGGAAGDYADSATDYAGPYCASGTTSATPAFPAKGSTVSWTCDGANGGNASELCTARHSLNGRCGAAEQNYVYSATTFAGPFCATGTANPANPPFPAQNGSSVWTCSGSNGGNDSGTCTANRGPAPEDGLCGAAAGDYPENATAYAGPHCASGTASAAPGFPNTGAIVTWTCSGLNGGADSDLCTARRALNGTCGNAAQNYAFDAAGFTGSFCATGSADPAVPAFPAQNGTSTWLCNGLNGGTASPSCVATRAAPRTNGLCGAAERTYTFAETAYAADLCAAGTADPTGPAFPEPGASGTWRCLGSGGGTNDDCVAPRQAGPACGTRARNYLYSETAWPSGSTWCAPGTKTPATTGFPPAGASRSWNCSQGGETVACTATRNATPVNGQCGTAEKNYAVSDTAFSGTFCAAGDLDAVPAFPQRGGSRTWHCVGRNLGTTDTCTATRAQNGVCGANSRNYRENETAYTEDFCSAGRDPATTPAFPARGAVVNWTCAGINGGSSVTCPASRKLQPVCGTRAKHYLASNTGWGTGTTYCAPGTPSNPASAAFPAVGRVSTWNCTGAQGGGTVSCAATRGTVNGQCGPAAQVYAATATTWSGALCNNGIRNPNSPAFPAQGATTTWDCLGYGGSDAHCSATRRLPTADVCGDRLGTPFIENETYTITECGLGTIPRDEEGQCPGNWVCTSGWDGCDAWACWGAYCTTTTRTAEARRGYTYLGQRYVCSESSYERCDRCLAAYNAGQYPLPSGCLTRFQDGGQAGSYNTTEIYVMTNGVKNSCVIYYDEWVDCCTSPVSLSWNEGSLPDQYESATNFPIAPSDVSGANGGEVWYSWKASSDTPLLVYDPQHSGEIRSALQLFGNYTFGKKWHDGFEALGTLDADKDGKLSGAELKDLALWFDANRNGISEKGEVRTLAAAQVESLYYKPDTKQPANGDVLVSRGFERRKQGKIVSGPAIDWWSAKYGSKKEAEAGIKQDGKQVALNDSQRRILKQVEREAAEKEKNGEAKIQPMRGPDLSGRWAWSSPDAYRGQKRQGVLVIQDQGETITGFSYFEVPGKGGGKEIKATPLSGRKLRGKDGNTVIGFEVRVPGPESVFPVAGTFSSGGVSADGKAITGSSKAQISGQPSAGKAGEPKLLQYSWTARKIE